MDMGAQRRTAIGAWELLFGPTRSWVVESTSPLKNESEGGESERENCEEEEETGSERLVGGRRRGSERGVETCHGREGKGRGREREDFLCVFHCFVCLNVETENARNLEKGL